MPRVIANPERMDQFAAELRHSSQDLERQAVGIRARLGQLGEEWRDQEYERFRREIEPAINEVKRLAERANTYATYLQNKARHLHRYFGSG